MEEDGGKITRVLAAARRGEEGAMDQLFPLVYEDLRARARAQLRRRRPGQTLETTALVHEAYLKLVDAAQADFHDRSHFFAAAATAMRHILVDHARRRTARKRGGEEIRVPLEPESLRVEARAVEVLALDQALTSLSELNAPLARLVELRFFAGLTLDEAAETLQLSRRTAERNWRTARAFLYKTLHEPPAPAAP
jgi:RNA polymerase sigma-70 factor, ECF subfamily